MTHCDKEGKGLADAHVFIGKINKPEFMSSFLKFWKLHVPLQTPLAILVYFL